MYDEQFSLISNTLKDLVEKEASWLLSKDEENEEMVEHFL